MVLKQKILIWILEGAWKSDGIRRRLLIWGIVRKIKEIEMNKSWKTNTAGIGAILTGIGAAVTAYSKGDMAALTMAITGIFAGIGLLAARDNGVSSEQAGIK